jgi:hypothetical protein
MSQIDIKPPGEGGRLPSAGRPKMGLFSRIVRSRHVRLFILVAIVLHLVAAVLLSVKPIHDWILGKDTGPRQVEATPWELRRAIDTLLKVYTVRFNETLLELVNIRSQLDTLQLAKLERMKAEDKDREEKIRQGVWPTADRPDRNAQYFPRIDITPPRFFLGPLPDTTNLGLVDLYRLHPPLEQEIGRIYERYHALEMAEALVDPIPLSQSIKNTRLTLPKRRDIQAHLMDTTRITSSLGEPLKKFKQELIDAWLETEDMVNTAKHWLELAESRDAGTLPGLFGAQYNIVPPPIPYFGHYLNPRLLRRVSLQKLIDPPVALGNAIGEGEVALGTEWLSVDRWYSVGPFTHPGATRRMEELERKYPPEANTARVNLDAVYQGKDGRPLMWKYRHIGTDFIEKGLRFEPYTVDNGPYCIWYFYTEVWSDKDRMVLGSFASDDYGVCWVNGQRIYQSPPDTQPWVPFTRYGFRGVPLRKGFNRFLFKLENATGTTAFSVVLMTYEDKDLLNALREGF